MKYEEITIFVKTIGNGYLVYGSKSDGGYSEIHTPTTYVATRDEVIAALPALFEAADALVPIERPF